MHEIPQTALNELANSGSLCPDCGGLHIASADTAIIASSIAERTGTKLDWCDCEGCEPCRTFREAVLRIIAASGRLDTSPHSEASL